MLAPSTPTATASSSTAAEDERILAAAALAAAEEQLQSWTARHAGTFVEAERRARSFHDGLHELLQQLSHTTVIIPVMDEGTSEKIRDLSEQHRIRRRTLLQHGSLLELLELPALMDACVRSQLYEEALQIAAFANTLQRRHPSPQSLKDQQQPSLTTVHAIIAQIRCRQVDLRLHLLQRLRRAVTVPECLETVTCVRRLHQIELEEWSGPTVGLERAHAALEYQLQIDFLEARDVWVEQPSLDPLTAGAAATAASGEANNVVGEETLLDAIERYRTRMFEVATQFNAIFRANTTTATASSSPTGDSATTTLLSLWMARRVQRFLTLLQQQLLQQQQQPHQLDAAVLRDCLEASVFFAASLGRLGADFTPQLAPILEPILVQTITRHWKEGVAQLHETLTICRDAGVAGPLTAELPDDETASSPQQSTEPDGNAPPLDQPQPAPKQLLALPPLARLVNAVLLGLNELRRCLLPTVFPTLRRCLDDDVLLEVRQLLLTNERTVSVPGLTGDAVGLREAAAALRKAWDTLVEPYVRGSLEAALGNATAARQYHQAVVDHLQQEINAKMQQQKQEEEEEEATTNLVEANEEELKEATTNPDETNEEELKEETTNPDEAKEEELQEATTNPDEANEEGGEEKDETDVEVANEGDSDKHHETDEDPPSEENNDEME